MKRVQTKISAAATAPETTEVQIARLRHENEILKKKKVRVSAPERSRSPELPAVVIRPEEPKESQHDMDRIIVRRYKDEYTVIGPPVMIRPFDDIVDGLMKSDFLVPWLREQVEKHLRAGHEIVNMSLTGNPKAIYKMCTEKDVRELSTAGELEAALARPADFVKTERTGSAASRRQPRAGVCYQINVGKADIPDAVKGQPRIVLEIVSEHLGGEPGEISSTELKLVLDTEANRTRLKTKPDRDLMSLWSFCMSEFYRKLKLVERVERAESEAEEPEEPEETEEESE